MISEKLNVALIDLIYKHIPEHVNPANLLADTLNIGREAAYRRLRGEVFFTLGEAAQLASKLNFSLDRTMGMVGAGSILFQLCSEDLYSTLEVYSDILQKDIRFLREVAADPTAIFATAGSSMPAEFYMRYANLAKFKFFRWLYQHGKTDPGVRAFEQLEVPDSLVCGFSEYVSTVQEIAISCYVIDNYGFKHWINGIRTFRALNLLSNASIRVLKIELLQLLDEMEQITVNGGYSNGNKVMFYLSDVDLEASYSYISTSRYKASCVGVFSLNALRTYDLTMYDHVKRWVQTQTRFATLITGSGELQRVRYFQRQRELVETLEREGDIPSPEACQG